MTKTLNLILVAIVVVSILNLLVITVYNVANPKSNDRPKDATTLDKATKTRHKVSSAVINNRSSRSTKRNTTWTTTKQTSIPRTRLLLTSRFKGRLGNQMFIYAGLVGLARAQDREPFMSNGGFLKSLFRVSHIKRNIYTNGWSFIAESTYAAFDDNLLRLPQQNMVIFGFLQCWRYFQHAQKEIRKEYTFTAHVQKKVQRALKRYRRRLKNKVLVGVHIRRGDLATPDHAKLGYGVANASYFVNAFGKMRSLLTNQNIAFLVGSDDLDWCKNNLNDAGIEILPHGSPADHFAILSSCDHAIITGGTFGWWIGWLANGITIYYKNYVVKNASISVGFNESDYYPKGWIALE